MFRFQNQSISFIFLRGFHSHSLIGTQDWKKMAAFFPNKNWSVFSSRRCRAAGLLRIYE